MYFEHRYSFSVLLARAGEVGANEVNTTLHGRCKGDGWREEVGSWMSACRVIHG